MGWKCENCGAEGDPNDVGSCMSYQVDRCGPHGRVTHHYVHCDNCGHDREDGAGEECPQCSGGGGGG